MASKSNQSDLKSIAGRYMRDRIGLFDSEHGALTPETCYERIVADGTCSIYLYPDFKVSGPRKRKNAIESS